MTNIVRVSKKAGVSTATVSRTFSNPEKVNATTREAVLKAASELNYRPNSLARGLRVKRASVLVVLVPDISNPYFSRVIRGIETQAQKRGYSILLGNTAGERERELFYASLVYSSQADGVIQLSASYPFEPDTKDVPIVNICECFDTPDAPKVMLDNKAGARAVTDLLVGYGHTRIAVVKGPDESPLTRERLKGYRAALRAAKIKTDKKLEIEGDFTARSGEAAVDKLLAQTAPPTAIFCQNDEMAFGAMKRLKECGFSVPDDISVAGFDNIRFSEYCDPPLTTVSQPADTFGIMAVDLLCDAIESPNKTPVFETHTLPFKLVIRNSCGPLRN